MVTERKPRAKRGAGKKKTGAARAAARADERALLSAGPDQALLLDVDGAILAANDRAAASLGRTADDLIGACLWDLLPPDVAAARKVRVAEVLATGRPTSFSDASAGRELEHRVQPVPDGRGRVTRVAVFARDITDERRSEVKFRTITEQIGDLVALTDGRGVITYASGMARAMFRIAPEAMVDRHFIEFLDKPSVPKAVDAFQKAVTTGTEVRNLELVMKRADGSLFDGELTASHFRLGEQESSLVVIRDITERKRTEREQFESLTRFYGFAEASQYGLGMADLDGRIIYVNRTLAGMLGEAAPEDCLGKHFPTAYYTEADSQRLRDEVLPALMRDGHWHGELMLLAVDGRLVPTDENYFVLRDERGQPRYFADILTDITERKRAEEALRASEERYRYLADNISDVVWIRDINDPVNLPYRYVSPSLAHLLGGDFDSALQIPLRQLIPPAELARLMGVFYRELPAAMVADRHRVWIEETQHVRLDGTLVPVEMAMKLVFDEAGVPYGLMGVTRDITDRKKAEAEMRGLHERFSKAFHHNPSPMFITRLDDGRFIDVNRAFEALVGWDRESLIGASSVELDLHTAEVREALLRKVAEKGQLRDVAAVLQTRGGARVEVLASAEPMEIGGVRCLLGALIDVSNSKRAQAEKEHLQEQLRQATKMEAVGRLAGGVAHDFNNLLTVILGYTRILLGDLDRADPLREDLQEVQHAAERASTLTNQLLAFSRKQVIAPRVQSLNDIIENARRMLQRIIGEDVELEAILSPDLPPVKVDSSQIDQILVNLAVNARDAMPEGGKLTLRTLPITADEVYCRLNAGMKAGAYALLAVSDNGCGMDEETRQRIFDPFFTTKELGKGTGLGLAVVYGAVQQNDGVISVYSEPGVGTTFKIFLPAADVGAKAEEAAQLSIAMLPRGEGTILLVEDEEMVRRLARMVLQRQGYRILETSSGQEAIDLCRGHDGPIDLLLTDVIMPGMNGKALLDAVLPLRAGLKVLFMSGYTESVIAHHGVLDAGTNFIQKPFSVEELVRKVREALRRA